MLLKHRRALPAVFAIVAELRQYALLQPRADVIRQPSLLFDRYLVGEEMRFRLLRLSFPGR